MLHALFAIAHAGYIAEIGDEFVMAPNGTFHRSAPNGPDGWLFFIGTGGSYKAAETDNDHSWDRGNPDNFHDLMEREDIIDRGITRCPDGTWLYAGSGTQTIANDSGYLFKASADLVKTNEATVDEGATDRVHNDMALVCAKVWSGVIYNQSQAGYGFEVDPDGNITGEVVFDGAPGMMGGGILALDDAEELLLFGQAHSNGAEVAWARYDADQQFVDSGETTLINDFPGKVFWPQGVLRVGDIYALAFMAREHDSDIKVGEGDVWVALLDSNLELLESAQLTAFRGTGKGSMRPGISRRGDTLVISYDVQVEPRLTEVKLNLDAFDIPGDSADPSGWGDSGDDGGGIPPIRACGCGLGASSGGSALGLAALVLWGRRRR